MTPAAEAVRIIASLLALALIASLGVIVWEIVRGVMRNRHKDAED